jgi:DnaJ family protein C protein 9
MQGDVTLILENIMLSENDDLPRFIETYENLIKEKKLKRCKAFDISKKKVKLLEEPNEEEQIEIAASLSSLKSQIAIRN